VRVPIRWTSPGIVLLALVVPAAGSDGVIEISQAQALAGGVTPGDAPGFPVTLSETGSYVLTSNLVIPDPDTGGIEIVARQVTVDLNGFTVLGPASCNAGVNTTCTNTGAGRGIYTPILAWTGPVVRNGLVRGVGGNAIDLSQGARVENVQVIFNGGAGITVANGSHVVGNTVRGNGGSGIVANQGSTVHRNTVANNAGDGIAATALCNVSENAVSDSQLTGIVAGVGSRVVGNTIGANDGGGMALQGGAGYAGNVLYGNNGTVTGGVQIGTNLCDGSTTCP